MSATTTTPSNPSHPAAEFLSLPYELRLEIYQYLLVDDADGTSPTPDLTSAVKSMSSSSPYPCYPFPYWQFTAFGAPIPKHQQRPPTDSSSRTISRSKPRNGAAILRTNHQIHDETLPILYSQNQFVASDSLLTRWPHLPGLQPVKYAESNPRISALLTRFRLPLRLDIPPRFTAEAATSELSGKQELVIDVSQATWRGAGPDHLRRFEGVRGVKRAKVVGSTGGFEAYARWLEQSMMAPVGSVVKPFRGVMEREFDTKSESGGSITSDDTETDEMFSSVESSGSSLSSSPVDMASLGLIERGSESCH